MFHIGDRVGYACIPHLMTYRGTLTALGRTPHGGDCTVAWEVPTTATSEECLANLRVLPAYGQQPTGQPERCPLTEERDDGEKTP